MEQAQGLSGRETGTNGKKKKTGIPERRELVRKVFEHQNQNQSQPTPGPSQRQRPGLPPPHPSIPRSQYLSSGPGLGPHPTPPPPRTQQTQQRRGRYEEYPLDSSQNHRHTVVSPYDDASDMGSPESINVIVPGLISPVRGAGVGGGGGRGSGPANAPTHNTHSTQPNIHNDDIDIDPFAPDPSEAGGAEDEGASYLHDDMRNVHPVRAVQPMGMPMSVDMDMGGYGYGIGSNPQADWGGGHSRNTSQSHSRNHSRGHSRSASKALGSEREGDGVKAVDPEDEGEGEEGEFFPGSGLFGSFGSR